MKVDIIGYGNHFTVLNSETREEIEGVRTVSLYLTKDGKCEALLYVSIGRLDLRGQPRGSDGVRAG